MMSEVHALTLLVLHVLANQGRHFSKLVGNFAAEPISKIILDESEVQLIEIVLILIVFLSVFGSIFVYFLDLDILFRGFEVGFRILYPLIILKCQPYVSVFCIEGLN